MLDLFSKKKIEMYLSTKVYVLLLAVVAVKGSAVPVPADGMFFNSFSISLPTLCCIM